ncbi:GNAT family N-acetyltransferase [Rhodobacteraceae bacterium DSL-40]|uniref:GNAT family N-acetyltransferase n=1 Tax=Amaricoccus sp. B4 TaxID=3368557 RepID=UPI000DACB3C4
MALVAPIESEIATARLRLRRLCRSDAALLALYASDARVARMTAHIPHPYPPGQAEAFVERALSPSSPIHYWAIVIGGAVEEIPEDGTIRTNSLIGLVSLRPAGDGSAEIAYWVAPAVWGTGYASESVRTICEAAGRWGIHTITAQVFQDNAASIRVLMRTGFTYMGAGETHSVARGAMVPTFLYRRASGIA